MRGRGHLKYIAPELGEVVSNNMKFDEQIRVKEEREETVGETIALHPSKATREAEWGETVAHTERREAEGRERER